jgi:hypothetical protein
VLLLYGKIALETVSCQERVLHDSIRLLMEFRYSVQSAVFFPVSDDNKIMGISVVKEVRIPYNPIAMTEAEVAAAVEPS